MATKKKFCFFIATDRHHDEIVIFRQAKSLIDAGYAVTLVVSDNEPEEIIDGVRVIPNGFVQGGYFKRVTRLPSVMYRKAKEIDADVYQTCSVDLLSVGLRLRRHNKKVIFHLREGHPYTFVHGSPYPKWLTKMLISLMVIWMKYSLKRYDYVITVTDSIANYLNQWGIKKISVQGNYPIINQEYELSWDDYSTRENRLFYFGLVYTVSRQQYVLDALQKVENVKYLIAGKFTGNNWYYEQLKEHPKWKDVEFINGFKHEELSSFFRQSTICNVLRDFSRTESPNGSLGIIKIFESMEAALPIICSDVPVYREMMKKYKCGILVDPKNSEQIAKAIQYLVDHKEEAYQMGQEGRRAVIEEYSWDAQSKVYLDIVDNLL